jgi:hypothetical protein
MKSRDRMPCPSVGDDRVTHAAGGPPRGNRLHPFALHQRK